MPSNAETYFDEIIRSPDPYQTLEQVPNSEPPTFETEWLEFKGNVEPKDVLKVWSEAVSGFANTEGGVLIWGIDCRKVDNVDAAARLVLVPDPVALKSKLLTNISQTTDPPVQGIRIKEITGPNGQGFLVCLIPESKNKPHRAEQQKNKPYMIRAGDSFLVANPSLLRSMFYPKSAPDLRLTVSPLWEAPYKYAVNYRPPFRYMGQIWNNGKATASEVFLVVWVNVEVGFGTGDERWEMATIGSRKSAFTFRRQLHPDMRAIPFLFDAYLEHSRDGQGFVRPTAGLEMEAVAYARDMEPRYFRLNVSRSDAEDRRPLDMAICDASDVTSLHRD